MGIDIWTDGYIFGRAFTYTRTMSQAANQDADVQIIPIDGATSINEFLAGQLKPKRSSLQNTPQQSTFKTPLPVVPITVKSAVSRSSSSALSKSVRKVQSSRYDIYSSTKTVAGGLPSSTVNTTIRYERSYVIVAIVEGRGLAKGEVGLASMDIRHPELCLTQFADTASYDRLHIKLQILNPIEILLPFVCGGSSLLHRGDSKHNFFAVVDSCNPTTAKSLELMTSQKCVTDTEHSLFGVLNHTFTAGGQRLLRSSILQPSTNALNINQRLDAVVELLANEPIFSALRSIVSRMLDVDRLITLCSHTPNNETIKIIEFKMQQLLHLKHTLEYVDQLKEKIGLLKSPIFQNCFEMLNDTRFNDILVKIYTVINEDARVSKSVLDMKMQKCFAVRSNLNGLLDLARQTYSELLIEIQRTCSAVVEETGIPFGIGFTADRGFFLKIYANRNTFPKNPPPLLVNISKRSNLVTCTTKGLIKLNDRVTEAKTEIMLMSNIVITELLASIRGNISCLFNLTDVISKCDFISSLANNCLMANSYFCALFLIPDSNECLDNAFLEMYRPIFGDSIALQQCRHPILENFSANPIIPNDVYIGPAANFVLITGPNMTGKSTYLKMVAVVQIMAQMGSFVPASNPVVRIADRIFTRAGQNDDMENNKSAFQVEMNDVSYILKNFTKNSLIIIDELARSTSAEEGYALSHAICEEFIASQAFVIFSTHFLDLANLDGLYSNVENFCFSAQIAGNKDKEDKIVLNHHLKRGSYRGPLYGFEVASLSKFPVEVIDRARQLAMEIRAQREANANHDDLEIRRKRATQKLAFRLKQAKENARTVSKEVMIEHFRNLKAEYLNEIAECDALEKLVNDLSPNFNDIS
uniref:DNA mismatch repair proteins mutS family domain-containing protein n=1 Tax=Romanomermis culicivorax TaxID=13658 RepID=A0A915L816_ROMCU